MGERQYCLVLELRDDERLIGEYEAHHRPGKVWPEVIESIRGSGIEQMRIYRIGASLIMVLDVDEGFSFEAKAASDAANPKVREWESLMARFQKAAEGAAFENKWRLADNIFRLTDH